MDHNRILLQPLAKPGEVTTFYAYEGGAARHAALSALALHLASASCNASADSVVARYSAPGQGDSGPVLIIDWDLEAPALHRHFALPLDAADPAGEGGDGAPLQPGLLEFFESCRAHLHGAGGHGEEPAERAIDSAGWQDHIERADGRRPLYLMRAGRFDDSYPERAGRLDWEALFDASPALFRRFAVRMARYFRHVLVASGGGRSAAAGVCSTLLPDRVVGLFTPAPGSLEGLEALVRRAIDYRCTHEDEQRPLLVYPLACSADGARSDPHGRWRRGDVRNGAPGYQPRLEALLRACYGWPRVNLDSYFDEVQLALADAISTIGPGGDRRAMARFAAQLGEWLAPGYFPWQSREEIRLRAALALARTAAGQTTHDPAHGQNQDQKHEHEQALALASNALADALARLGAVCRRERRRDEARACFEECLALRERLLAVDHAATRAARAALAGLLFESGSLHDARRHYDLLVQACTRRAGADDPETLLARSQMARALAGLGEGERALALHEQVVAACERALGEDHTATLGCLEDLARSLVCQRETTRARIVYERVLEGRRRCHGAEHQDTLRCAQALALLLGEAGELGNARRMLEAVLRARERHDGPDAAGTLGAREALAEILAAQGDLAAVRSIQESLAHTRERHLGAGHPDTLNMQLRLASTLGQQGEAEAAHRLREQVADLRQRLQEAEGWGKDRAGLEEGAARPSDSAGLEPARSGLAASGTAALGALPPDITDAAMTGLGKAAAFHVSYHDRHGHETRRQHEREPVREGRGEGRDDGRIAGEEHARADRSVGGDAHDISHAADALGHKLAQLQDLIDSRSPGEARALADSLRTSVLRPSAAHPLRRRGAAMIKQVYLQDGDKDALLSFTQDEVSLLEGALIEAARDHPMTMR
jgi:tetratricopeptide (TPR) repeat protein